MRSGRKFELRLDGGPYPAGASVSGTVVAQQRIRARSLKVALRYVDKSPDYDREVTHASAVVHEGDISPGQEFEFSLPVPSDAPPRYASRDYGRLYWELAVRADVPRGLDAKDELEIDAGGREPTGAGTGGAAVGSAGGAREPEPTFSDAFGPADEIAHWRPKKASNVSEIGSWVLKLAAFFALFFAYTIPWGLAISFAGWIGGVLYVVATILLLITWLLWWRRTKEGFDVEITPSSEELSRGEELGVDVTIGDTDPKRRHLRVGLVCYANYEVSSGSSEHGGGGSTTRTDVEVERWPELDLRAPQQRLTFQIPNAAPFTYEGDALSFEWKVVAREHRRLRPDPERAVPLQVRP